MRRIILAIIFVLFATVSFADVNIIIENNSTKTKIYRVKWLNHPHGCYVVFGVLKCDYDMACGEIDAGKKLEYTLKKGHAKIGNKFMITIEPLKSYLEENPIIEKHRFTVKEDTKEIYIRIDK